MPAEAAQQQIDSRALELATAAETRIKAHEEHCNTREDQAALGRAELRADMRAGFDKLEASVKDLGDTLHKRISEEKAAGHRLVLGLAGSVIALLLVVAGFLFIRAVGWA